MADYDNSRSSPLSDIPSESCGNTLEKALIRRNVMIKNNNGNFRAGYVPVHEQDAAAAALPSTGLRGRRTWAFWTLISLLLVLAAGNLLLTFTVLGVLRLGQGMESLEFVPEESLIKFYGLTDLGEVVKRDGHLEGFRDSPVSVTADNQEARLSINLTTSSSKAPEQGPKIAVRPDGIAEVSKVLGFEVRDLSGKPVFSTAYPNFGLPSGVKRLDVQAARVSRIASPINSGLSIGSDSYVTLRGNEGTRIEGKEIVWSADQDLWLRSVNGSILMSGQQGVALDVQALPLVSAQTAAAASAVLQFKLCVCRTKGRLFRVRLPATCLGYVGASDPCAA